MHRGYVKLYRKSIENPLFKKPLIWHYFEYCLLKANHKDKKMIWNKKEITIERGSFLTGRIEAAKETGLSEQNVRTAQKTLINVGALLKINEKSTSKNTYLTVCNYNDYQEDKKTSNQQPTSNQPASNQQVTTNNNEQELISTSNTSVIAQEIFDFWASTMEKKRSIFTKERKKSVTGRLKEGYTIDQIKEAITGCSKDPFSMGKNDRNKRFDDLELICRTGKKLESFFSCQTPFPKSGGQPKEIFKTKTITDEDRQKQIEINKQNSERLSG